MYMKYGSRHFEHKKLEPGKGQASELVRYFFFLNYYQGRKTDEEKR